MAQSTSSNRRATRALLLYLNSMARVPARCSPGWSRIAATRTFGWASVFPMPLALLLGLQSLSCWYLVQVLPMDGTPLPRLTGTWIGAGFVMLAIWVAAALGWAWLLRVTVPQALDDESASGLTPLLLFSGAVGLLVAVLGHYMLVAFERSTLARASRARAARARARIGAALVARAARSALPVQQPQLGCRADRLGCAVRASHVLPDGGFFRKSLQTRRQELRSRSPKSSRWCRRFLRSRRCAFASACSRASMWPTTRSTSPSRLLVLQPLVENAVKHGVAHLVEGGEVTVRAHKREGLLELIVENPCDPERPPSRGAGVGLANVRSRIDTLFAHRASVDVNAQPTWFRVAICAARGAGDFREPDNCCPGGMTNVMRAPCVY